MIFNIPKEITDQLSSIEKIINNIVNQFKIKFSKINHDLDKINDSITAANSNLSDVYNEYHILQLPRNFRIIDLSNNVVTIGYDYDNDSTASQEFTIDLENTGTYKVFLYKIKDDDNHYYVLYPEYIDDEEVLNELEKSISRIFAFEYTVENDKITYLSTDGVNYLLEDVILNDVNSEIDNLKETLSSAYIYRGSVDTYSSLPCGDKVLKIQLSQRHYIELSFPDNSIPKDAAKIRINAKSSTGSNYNFILMGTSDKSYNFYIQKDRYTDETIDISDFDYTTSNGKFRISFTANGGNILEIDKIYFLNSSGSTIKTIFIADTYAINSKGPVVSSTASSVTIAYKNPDSAAEQKSTLQIGDVYNVSDSDKNYAWNGTDWDSLGGTFSLTNYQSREDTRLKTTSKYIVGAINELKTFIDNEEDTSNSKQDKLIVGNGINISDNIISVDTEVIATKDELNGKENTLVAYNGIRLDREADSGFTNIFVDTDIIATKEELTGYATTEDLNSKADLTYVDGRFNSKADTTYVDNLLNNKQDTLTAGKGIEINDDVIGLDSSAGVMVDQFPTYTQKVSNLETAVSQKENKITLTDEALEFLEGENGEHILRIKTGNEIWGNGDGLFVNNGYGLRHSDDNSSLQVDTDVIATKESVDNLSQTVDSVNTSLQELGDTVLPKVDTLEQTMPEKADITYVDESIQNAAIAGVDLTHYQRKLFGTNGIQIHEEAYDDGNGDIRDLITLDDDAQAKLSDFGPYAANVDILMSSAQFKAEIKNTLDSTLVSNTDYYLGDVSTDTALSFPSTAEIGDTIYVNFNCATAFALTIDTTYTSDIDIDIEAGVNYEIFASWNGLIWILGYNEYTVS